MSDIENNKMGNLKSDEINIDSVKTSNNELNNSKNEKKLVDKTKQYIVYNDVDWSKLKFFYQNL